MKQVPTHLLDWCLKISSFFLRLPLLINTHESRTINSDLPGFKKSYLYSKARGKIMRNSSQYKIYKSIKNKKILKKKLSQSGLSLLINPISLKWVLFLHPQNKHALRYWEEGGQWPCLGSIDFYFSYFQASFKLESFYFWTIKYE